MQRAVEGRRAAAAVWFMRSGSSQRLQNMSSQLLDDYIQSGMLLPPPSREVVDLSSLVGSMQWRVHSY